MIELLDNVIFEMSWPSVCTTAPATNITPQSGRQTRSKAPTTSGDWKIFINFFFGDEAQAVDIDIVGMHGLV